MLPLTLLFGLAALPVRSLHAADLRLADAMALALAQNPNIAVQRSQANALHGVALQATSQFDWVLAADANISRDITPLMVDDIAAPASPVWEQTRQTASGYQVGVSKQLRNGLTFGTSVAAAAVQDTTPGVVPGQQNSVKLNVSLIVPLWRGRGAAHVAGAETAAALNALASEYMVRDRVAQTVHDVAVAYWTYRSRVELEKITVDADERSATLLASTQSLVDHAEKPRADLTLIKADHADKIIARKAATLSSTNARNSLGRALGIGAMAIGELVPGDPVPGPQGVPDISAKQIREWVARALQRRPDLSVLSLQLEAAVKLRVVARDNLAPQMDLQLGAGYGKVSAGGSRFGFLHLPGRMQSGPSLSALLSIQFSIENNFASGALAQSAAAVDQLEVRRRDLQIAIVNSVEAAAAAVISSAERTRIAKDGLSSYQQAIENEVIKQRNGFSTLIDVINIESKYVEARVNYLQLELEYAIAVVDLRWATGTLLPEVAPGAGALERIAVDVDDVQGLGGLAL